MKYDVASGTNLTRLIEQVNKYIALGWKPQGGISVTNGGYYQSVVKKVN